MHKTTFLSRNKENLTVGLSGVATFGALAFVIEFPVYWYVSFGALFLFLIWMVCVSVRGSYRLTQPVLGIVSIIVPAVAVLFLVRDSFWQYVYAIGVACTVMYYFVFISYGNTGYGRAKATGLVLLLANIFFASGASVGISAFFSVSRVIATVVFAVFISLFPRWFVVVRGESNTASGSGQLDFGDSAKRLIKTSVWLRGQLLVGARQHVDDMGRFVMPIVEFTKRDSVVSWMLTLMFVEIFIIVTILPVGIFTSASVVTVVAFCAISLVQLNHLNLLRRGFVMRYIGMCAIVILLVLLSAQWS